MIEWPEDEKEPTKYWFSTLSEDTPFAELVDLTKLRWRIERDYQDLKQEVGLGHYEGRGWRGFHHHATLCITASRIPDLREGDNSLPPSGLGAATKIQKPAVPDGHRSRGAADPARATHPELDRHNEKTPHRRSRPKPPTMSLLQPNDNSTILMTQ